jgi:acetolactate synthase I/II/III large subunit
MRAADVIVKALEAQKLTRLYCVPGESYLPLLDALHDSATNPVPASWRLPRPS